MRAPVVMMVFAGCKGRTALQGKERERGGEEVGDGRRKMAQQLVEAADLVQADGQQPQPTPDEDEAMGQGVLVEMREETGEGRWCECR